MNRFIRLAARNLSRQRAQDVILQGRYDDALDRRGPDDPFVQELRARIIERKLNTREQGVMTFPETEEPWAAETNPAAGNRMRLEYVRGVNARLGELGSKMSWEERGLIDRLNDLILRETDPHRVSEAHTKLEGMLQEIEGRPEPPPVEPRFPELRRQVTPTA